MLNRVVKLELAVGNDFAGAAFLVCEGTVFKRNDGGAAAGFGLSLRKRRSVHNLLIEVICLNGTRRTFSRVSRLITELVMFVGRMEKDPSKLDWHPGGGP